MSSLLSSAADGCRFPTRLEGFLDMNHMITAFARLRGLRVTVPVDADAMGVG